MTGVCVCVRAPVAGFAGLTGLQCLAVSLSGSRRERMRGKH